MNFLAAFAMGTANRDKELMVFDWDRAAEIIKARKAHSASAGLSRDWGATSAVIFYDGKPTPPGDPDTYLASTWARPELCVDGKTFGCFKMQSETPGWDAETYWPESARAKLSE